MLTRIWHGKTRHENSEKYLDFLRNQGTKEYRSTPGNLSVRVWMDAGHDECHFWTVTEWESLEAVKAFAGEEYQKAKYYPEADDVLVHKEENVLHYESFDVSNSRIGEYIRQLKELYLGGSWQGEYFLEKMENFNETTAFLQPMEGIHSVAEITWHCIYWRNVTIQALNGNYAYRDSTLEKMNFLSPEELKKKGWNGLKNEFARSEEKLIENLYNRDDSFLKKEYKAGKTFAHLIEGIVQHDIYHLGQMGLVIAMLKKMNALV